MNLSPEEQPDCNSRKPWRQQAARVSAGVALTLSLLTAVPTVLALGARWHWLLDLTTHFPVQLIAGALPGMLVLIAVRRYKLALLPAGVILINGYYLLPFFVSQAPAAFLASTTPVYRAVSANLYWENRDRKQIVEFIRASNADIVVVSEMDLRWHAALQTLNDMFPYSVQAERDHPFGIALFSRFPVRSYEIKDFAESDMPTIVATIDFGVQRVTVIGAHPPPPVGSRFSSFRNKQLRGIAALCKESSRPVLVLGDLNTTSWSPHFQDMVDHANLHDSRRGFGIQPSWPDQPWLFRIPIDHALFSDGIRVVNRQLGPDVGSDHRPIVVEFSCER